MVKHNTFFLRKSAGNWAFKKTTISQFSLPVQDKIIEVLERRQMPKGSDLVFPLKAQNPLSQVLFARSIAHKSKCLTCETRKLQFSKARNVTKKHTNLFYLLAVYARLIPHQYHYRLTKMIPWLNERT